MDLPRLVPATNLPVNLPEIKDNQAWALNIDTSPPTLVLVEFVYAQQQTQQSIAQDSVDLLNTNINQAILSINSSLSNLTNRINTIESLINTNVFVTSPSGLQIG